LKKKKDYTKLFLNCLELSEQFRNRASEIKKDNKPSTEQLSEMFPKEEVVASIVVNKVAEHFKEKGIDIYQFNCSEFTDEINMVMEDIINE